MRKVPALPRANEFDVYTDEFEANYFRPPNVR
jgi:hypothetical protein